MQKISLAFSPDTDDAFMVRALEEHLIPTEPYTFEFISADIQTLNERALKQTYDVTAISVAAYPSISQDYFLMPIGASVGDNFGPALITRNNSHYTKPQELVGQKIAIPGTMTSAFFAARILLGPFEAVSMPFGQIARAVEDGQVEAGILIHELQMDVQHPGLRKLADLGTLWHEALGLPLPLGANGIKKSLGSHVITDVTKLLKQSIEYGLNQREETLKSALKRSGAAIDLKAADRYISMYVNERSLSHATDMRTAIDHLLTSGNALGLCPQFVGSDAFY